MARVQESLWGRLETVLLCIKRLCVGAVEEWALRIYILALLLSFLLVVTGYALGRALCEYKVVWLFTLVIPLMSGG